MVIGSATFLTSHALRFTFGLFLVEGFQSPILSDRETSDDKKMGQVGFEEKSILFYQGQHTNLF